MNYTEVVAALSKAGYYFRTEGSGAGTTTWTNVTAQSPVAGTALAKKKTITLTVTGASAATTTTAKSTSVTTTTTKAAASTTGETLPNFVGMTRSQVFAAMAKLKLYFTTHGPGAGTNAWQVVVSQSPAASSVVKPLSSVSLNVKE
jgi:beta-lactam-binding protein with PASTA domain